MKHFSDILLTSVDLETIVMDKEELFLSLFHILAVLRETKVFGSLIEKWLAHNAFLGTGQLKNFLFSFVDCLAEVALGLYGFSSFLALSITSFKESLRVDVKCLKL